MLKWHKKKLDWFQNKLGMSNYAIAWFAFLLFVYVIIV